MNELFVRPTLQTYKSCKEFAEDYKIGKDDLVISNEYIYNPYFGSLHLECQVVFQEKYGAGEPTDEMLEAIYRDLDKSYRRVIAIGGGTIIDISKVLALKTVSPLENLYDDAALIKKDKTLVIVPTTCGTGSEVTNISIFALLKKGTKKGLVSEAMYADFAVLVPELLEKLPVKVFAASSIDALIHAVESSLSPKATPTTKLFGYKAIDMILSGYKVIAQKGLDARVPLMADFLLASTYAGIAFGNAGVGAVHALSYPLGAAHHVPHGESNYVLFAGVMNHYMEIKKDGEIAALNKYIAGILGCDAGKVYAELEKLLGFVMERKPLSAYGMTEAEIQSFTDSVIANQQRLLANNFVFLDRDRIVKIYTEMYK
ncbi:MAG: 4-hydroxybutyrate dehydrogenase [Spirochaetaceae bacterium]|jgi:4-hydroxybutyrate dehydrogenase|nr:4-hydroxybutyrate dehydrogenase [Spirochaetaceae bacterium]